MFFLFSTISCFPSTEKTTMNNQTPKYKTYINDTNGLTKSLLEQKPIFIHYSSGSKGAGNFSLRVYQNGDLWRYSNTIKSMENGIPKRKLDEYAWRYEASVTTDGMNILIKLLESDFKNLKSIKENTGSKDRGMHYRCALYDEGFKEVVLPSGPLENEYLMIQTIDNAIYHNIKSN